MSNIGVLKSARLCATPHPDMSWAVQASPRWFTSSSRGSAVGDRRHRNQYTL